MKKFVLSSTLLIMAALALVACGAPQPAAPAATVVAQPAGIIAEGRLVPAATLDVAFAAPGQVSEVLVQEGDPVEKGQVLARLSGGEQAQAALARAQQEELAARQALDALETNAALALAQANQAVLTAQDQLDKDQTRYDNNNSDENKLQLDLSKARLTLAERTQKRLSDNGGKDPDLQAAAQARLDSAAAAVKAAQVAQASLDLTAPAAGTVTNLNLQAGQVVSAGLPVLRLVDFSRWVVKTDNLTEVDVVRLSLGMPVKVVFDALPEKTFEGEVTSIPAYFEEKRGDITYTVSVDLPAGDPALRWGMTAAVTFVP